MTELTFSKNSWHYKLATWAGFDTYYHGSDICAYTRKVMLGIFFVISLFVAGAVMAYALADAVFGLVFSLMAGMWLTQAPGTITLICIGLMAAFFIFIWSVETFKEWRRAKKRAKYGLPEGPDGFIKQAYKSWKEKYCTKIKFVGNEVVEQGEHV